MVTAGNVENLVHAQHSRTGHRGCRAALSQTCLVEDVSHTRIEADKKLARNCVQSRLGKVLHLLLRRLDSA